MNKKDINELAEQLAIVRREYEYLEENAHPEFIAAWSRCVDAVVLACRATSASFNVEQFRRACNGDTHTEDYIRIHEEYHKLFSRLRK